MQKIPSIKQQHSYSENSTPDTLKVASDIVTKTLNITLNGSNISSGNDANLCKSPVLSKRIYFDGKNTKF